MTPPPLTLTARSILTAQRLVRLLATNQLAVSILRDDRAPAPPTAAQPAPNRTPGSGAGGVTTADYLDAYRREVDAVHALRWAEQNAPERVEAALIARAQAERHRREVEQALKDALTPRTRPGHLTAYRVRLPEVTFVHPEFGPHARLEAHTLTVDTAYLEGQDLAIFLDFMRDFPARGQWPLYAPHPRDGLEKVRNHPEAAAIRLLLERLILQHSAYLPPVIPSDMGQPKTSDAPLLRVPDTFC